MIRSPVAGLLVIAGLTFTSAAAPPLADAQGVDHADAEAYALFESGRGAFTAGRFEDALGYFRRSFELSRRPELLYNVGVSADRLRLDAEALEAFRGYVAAVPDAENRDEVLARIAILERAVPAGDGATRPPEPVEPEPAAPEPSDPETEPTGVVSPSRRDESGPAIGVAGGVIAGVGLVAGGLLGGLALAADARLEQTCSPACGDGELAELGTLTALTDVSFGLSLAGAALLAVGIGLELGAQDDDVVVVALPSTDGAAFLMGGRF
jgi:hypothetical protein